MATWLQISGRYIVEKPKFRMPKVFECGFGWLWLGAKFVIANKEASYMVSAGYFWNKGKLVGFMQILLIIQMTNRHAWA